MLKTSHSNPTCTYMRVLKQNLSPPQIISLKYKALKVFHGTLGISIYCIKKKFKNCYAPMLLCVCHSETSKGNKGEICNIVQ